MTSWERFFQLFPEFLAELLFAAVMTVEISIGALVVALVLGIVVALLRQSRSGAVRWVAAIYIQVFRCIPVLTQLFIIYFGLGQIGLRLNPLSAAVVGFGLNGAAYLAEIFRSGIEAVPRGQHEAASAIGMTSRQVMRWIILPQAIKISLPPIGNYGVGLLKDTSIAMAIAAPEIAFTATKLINMSYLSTQIYLLMALIYICLSLPLSYLVRMLERKSSRRAG